MTFDEWEDRQVEYQKVTWQQVWDAATAAERERRQADDASEIVELEAERKAAYASGVAAERERCAKVAENAPWNDLPFRIAAAIRSGKEADCGAE